MHPFQNTDLNDHLKIMNAPRNVFVLTCILLARFSCSLPASADSHNNFLDCLSQESDNYSSISNLVYTPTNSSYYSILRFPIWNLRFLQKSTPKPLVIITPEHESQIPPIVYCAKENSLEIRTRSGGHDYEGVSYVSQVPFVIIDLIKLGETTVDIEEKTAWVEGGATLGSIYYRIAEKSSVLGFSAGYCPTVGVGGHISGGGYGVLFRKYGLAADNVIDARIVDVNGRILDRKSMGEDLFWAIRGGGGASFGVITAWKIQLVDVPEKVTVFRVQRTLEQNLTRIIHRYQYVAPTIDRDLYIGIMTRRVNSSQGNRNTTITASFFSNFLGGVDRLLRLMQESFPELGLVREDCTEMSWIESVLFIAGFANEPHEVLLNRKPFNSRYFKAKTDYVKKPIPEYRFEDIWRLYFEEEGELSNLYIVPYGGRMDEISESTIPFPHRAGNLYMIANFINWEEDRDHNSDRYLSWGRRVFDYMTPYVSKSPREAYINYRDLDIGVNNNEGETSYEQASIWGKKYFKNNFDRLVRVKTVVDPNNFFRYEQSIPSLHSRSVCNKIKTKVDRDDFFRNEEISIPV